MNSPSVQRPLGPPTGSIETVERHGNKCELKWIIDQFPLLFKTFQSIVSPHFEYSGIRWQFIMYNKFLENPVRDARFRLLLSRSSINSSTSSARRSIAYKICLLDKDDSIQEIKVDEEQFTGSEFLVPGQLFIITDILDDCDVSDSDVFSFHLEMMIKATPSEL